MGRRQPIKNHSVYHVPSHTQNKLPENIIIDLHEMLLTKGIHRINVVNQLYGRTLINTLLISLNYYQNIGFLSLDNANETGEFHDVYTLLNECGYLDKDGNVTGWLHRAAFPSINTLFDPSVQFGLQFDAGIDEPEESTGSVQQLTATKVDALPSPTQDDDAEPADKKSEDGADAEEGDTAGSADVVSLDAFRKK